MPNQRNLLLKTTIGKMGMFLAHLSSAIFLGLYVIFATGSLIYRSIKGLLHAYGS